MGTFKAIVIEKTETGQDVEVKCAVRRDILNCRIVTQQIACRNFVDRGVIEYAVQGTFEPLDVPGVRFDQQVDIFSCPCQAVQVEGDCTKNHILHAVRFESSQNRHQALLIHDGIVVSEPQIDSSHMIRTLPARPRAPLDSHARVVALLVSVALAACAPIERHDPGVRTLRSGTCTSSTRTWTRRVPMNSGFRRRRSS